MATTNMCDWSTYREDLEILGKDASEFGTDVLLGLFVLLERTCYSFPQEDHNLKQANHHCCVFD